MSQKAFGDITIMLKIVHGLIALGLTNVRADNHDDRTINEAWGDDADISDCYATSINFGDVNGGTARSDISLLVDTELMSFAHRVTAIRVC